jgi:D-glycero-alpha-D-manno-heptose 1-phosphate guanylyltransferase
MLASKGFARVVLSLGFMSEKIIKHFGESFAGIDLVYEVESKPLGTGGAIRAALARCVTDHVFIFNGDTYLDIEADALELLWQARRHPVIVVRDVPDTARFGRVEMRDGRIIAFLEKGKSGAGLINAGCYVLPKDALEGFRLGQSFSLETEYFIPNLQRIWFDGLVTCGRFIDIGVPDDYALAQTELAGL